MGDGPGEIVLRPVVADDVPTRAILCTGASDPIRLTRAARLGPEVVFGKPIEFEEVVRVCESAELGVHQGLLHDCPSESSRIPHSGLAKSYHPILRSSPGKCRVPGEDVDRAPLLRIHRGLDLDETTHRPEPQVCDVAAALLRLAPEDRRAFILPLIAMLKRVAVDEERHRADRDLIAHPARTAVGRIGRLAR
jgi:hypothetical protein